MRKGRLIVTIVLIAVLTAALPAVVMADTGPKPSVVVSFTGAGDEEFYGTLLSKNDSSGPAHVWDGKEETTEISRKFIEYKDADGYYFCRIYGNVRQIRTLSGRIFHRLNLRYFCISLKATALW